MIIVYCNKCGVRVADRELVSGAATKDGDDTYLCAKCAPGSSPKRASGIVPVPGPVKRTSGIVPVPGPVKRTSGIVALPGHAAAAPVTRQSRTGIIPPRRSSSQEPAVPPPVSASGAAAPKPRSFLIAVGLGTAGAVFFIGALLFTLLRGSSSEVQKPATPGGGEHPATAATPPSPATPAAVPAPAANPAPSPPATAASTPATAAPTPEKKETTEEWEKMMRDRAAKVLEEAKAIPTNTLSGATEYRQKLQTVTTTYRGTPAAEEATKLLAAMPADPEPETTPIDDAAWQDAKHLVPLVDVQKDAVAGLWKIEGDALVCSKTGTGKIQLPYEPPAEYDLRVVFKRTDGNDMLLQFLSGCGKHFLWCLSHSNNSVSGLTQVRGQGANTNPTATKHKVAQNKKITTVVQVRKDGVKLFVDGKLLTHWKTDYSDMGYPAQWKIKDETHLGLCNANSQTYYYALDVRDVTGQGKTLRQEGPPVAAPAVAAGDAAPAKKADESLKLTPAEIARGEYEQLAADIYTMLAKDGSDQAIARLAKAKSDPRLAPVSAALAQDEVLARWAAGFRKAELAGVAALVDKRAFVFKRKDGKEIRTGKGSTISVTGVKDDDVLIQEVISGQKAETKFDYGVLSPATRVELLQIGLPAEPESELKLALADVLLLQDAMDESIAKHAEAHLEAARKAKAPDETRAHLERRLVLLRKEAGADAAYGKIEQLLADKKWEEAETFIQDFKKEHRGLKALARLQPAMEKHLTQIAEGMNPLKPGVWASYWSGDNNNKFKKLCCSRVETRLWQNWGNGSPDKSVPGDNFGARYNGVLRVEKEGRYAFKLHADDWVGMWIAGKKIDEKKEDSVQLAKGDHEIKIEYKEGNGGANFTIKWKPDGAADWLDIPPEALWYDPRETAKYEQK
jgi:hypothetical protein